MGTRRSLLTFFLAAGICSMGCESTSTDHGPTHDCVSVAGVWDINMVGDAGPGIVCPNRNLVWTLLQSGCDVTIEGESWDSANGAVTDNRLYAEWTWFQDCYRYHASLDVTVDGGTMNGTYYLGRTQAVYPAYCPGLGICSATLNGVRRAAAR